MINLNFLQEEELLNNDFFYRVVRQRYDLPEPNNFSRRGFYKQLSEMEHEFLSIVSESLKSDKHFSKDELQEYPLDVILGYLQKSYRLHLHKRLPEIDQTINILQRNYEESHPCLMLLELFFMDYREHLSKHIRHQQQFLIPYIEGLQQANRFGGQLFYAYALTGRHSLRDTLTDYRDEEELEKVRRAIHIYQPSTSNRSPYRILLSQLQLLEMDVRLCTRIEQEVLVPKAFELEQEIHLKMNYKSLLN